jgi:hypothetical protein
MRHFLSLLAFSFALLVTVRAHATAEFPGKIVSDLNITCANPIFDGNGCTICHTSNNGGLGTVTHPFGAYMKANGLSIFNDTQLQTLLTKLQNENPHTTDTNCDGKPDIDQLTTCDWQSLATVNECGVSTDGGVGPQTQTIIYGCSASPNEPALPASLAIGIAGFLAASVIRAKTRKRSADRDRRSSPR